MVVKALMAEVHSVVKIQAKLTAVLRMPPGTLQKNMVAAGLCDEVLVQVSYAIGVAKPCGLFIDTHGTAKVNMSDGGNSKKSRRDI